MSLSREELETLYRNESHARLRERLLLVLKVDGDGMIPAQVAKELHRSRTWTSDWLARYHKEGVDGLENRPKSGRPSKLSDQVAVKVRKKLKERKQGWTTQQVHEMIVKEGNVHYHQIISIHCFIDGDSNRSTKESTILMLHQMWRKSSLKKSKGGSR